MIPLLGDVTLQFCRINVPIQLKIYVCTLLLMYTYGIHTYAYVCIHMSMYIHVAMYRVSVSLFCLNTEQYYIKILIGSYVSYVYVTIKVFIIQIIMQDSQ